MRLEDLLSFGAVAVVGTIAVVELGCAVGNGEMEVGVDGLLVGGVESVKLQVEVEVVEGAEEVQSLVWKNWAVVVGKVVVDEQ